MDFFINFFEPFQETVSAYLPRLIPAGLILLAGLVVATVVKYIFRAVLRSGLSFMEKRVRHYRGMVSHDKEIMLIDVIPRLVYWLLVILSLAIVSEALGLPLFSTWLTQLIVYIPHILFAVVIVIGGIMCGSFLRDIIIKWAFRLRVPHGDVLGRAAQVTIVAVAAIIAVSQLGIDVSFLTTLAAIALAAFLFGTAIAFGMGANASIRNILACYYARKHIDLGQRIKVDGVTGTVAEITATMVVLDTEEGQVMLPGKVFDDYMTLILRSRQK